MRLQTFKIAGVKSIINTGVCHVSENDKITVLAGQNEAGKSAILEALNYFGNGISPDFVRLSRRLNVEPEVTCKFSLDESDLTTEDQNVNNLLKELKFFDCFRKGITEADSKDVYISDEAVEKIQQLIEKLNIFPIQEKATAAVGEVPEVASAAAVTTAEPTREKLKEDFMDKVVSHLVDALPKFILYNSFDGLLPGEIKIADVPSNQAVEDFQKIFDVNFAEAVQKNTQERTAIQDAVEKKAEFDLNTYWTQARMDGTEDRYRFDIHLLPNANPLEAKIEFLIHRDDGTPLFMEQKSKGFQWFNAFMLRLKAIGVENKDFAKYILLIDEPGQGLHETAQKNVKVVLEELASKGMTILYTTHNPSLIGVNDDELLRIRLVFQTQSEGTKINNIAQFASSNSGASKDALSPIISAMGIAHVGQIIDATKKCIVVEGITDHYYFSAFRQLLDISDEYNFIPACGVQNIRPLISVLIGWGARFKAIFDDGKEGKNAYKDIAGHLFKENETGLTDSIKKLDGFNGIEDLFTKNDFDKLVLGKSINGTKTNSEVAKQEKKELLARLFLEKVGTGKLKKSDLQQDTVTNFSNVFSWISS